MQVSSLAGHSITDHKWISGVARETTAARENAVSIPWYIWCSLLSVTSIILGGYWDVSWHQSIGRDTFWTPAHLAIYLGGALCGIAFGYIILHTTFSAKSPLRKSAVGIWGFRAPLGAFIASWGGIDMLTSAPFDNWWHGAYGLDVAIISPPHIALFVGVFAIIIGAMVLIAGYRSRASGTTRRQADWLFLYACSVILSAMMFLLIEPVNRPSLHNATPYILLSLLTPIAMTLGCRVTRIRFAATAIAGFYTFMILALISILPLFPAEPKLGPVYQQVTHFVPPQFPILLIVPAFALDLIFQRTQRWSAWKQALASGPVFSALLITAEWPLATYLMSSGAHSAFFATKYLPYAMPPQSFVARNAFMITWTSGAELWAGLLLACAAAILSVRFAISRGDWLHSLQR